MILVSFTMGDFSGGDELCEANISGQGISFSFRTRSTVGGVDKVQALPPGEYSVTVTLLHSGLGPNGRCVFRVVDGGSGRVVAGPGPAGSTETGTFRVGDKKTCEEKLEEMSFDCPHCCEEEFGDPVPKNDMKNTPECQKLRECKDCDGDGKKEFGSSSDGCSVPTLLRPFFPPDKDRPWGNNFQGPCDNHDKVYRKCYSKQKAPGKRRRADEQFREDVKQKVCNGDQASNFTCAAAGDLYHTGFTAANNPSKSTVDRYGDSIEGLAQDKFGTTNPGAIEFVCEDLYQNDPTTVETCQEMTKGKSFRDLTDAQKNKAQTLLGALPESPAVSGLTPFETNQECCREGELDCLASGR